MEAPLAIRAWTLLYSQERPLRSQLWGILTIVRASFLYPTYTLELYRIRFQKSGYWLSYTVIENLYFARMIV